MNAITISGLTKTYANGTKALKGIDLQVAQGDFCALLGANGAGKTTIIGILTGLVLKTTGHVKVFEHDIDIQTAQAKASMGIVPQEMNFNMFEKSGDIVVHQAGYYGVARHEAKARMEFLLKKLELWDKRNQPSRNLSGGMKRRLMIARALVNQPKLLILDEPTAGVDVELRHSMWEFLKELNRQGTTILLTTHYLEEVEQMCKNAAIIKEGQIIAFDAVKKLVNILEDEIYVVHVEQINGMEGLGKYQPKVIDENTFEVLVRRKEEINEFVALMVRTGMKIIDFRPKGNRMERLFLKLLR